MPANQTSDEPASLTREEAAERAALLEVDRYDIEVDLTDLLEGEEVCSVSTVRFTCREPGATTFVDCVAQIDAAILNGVELDVSTARAGRLPLPDLAAENVLEVRSRQRDTASSQGILRTVDSDGQVYVWTSFEPDDARRLWACFDQPDLKAVHGFTVSAPEAWTVLSNSAPDAVAEPADGARTWTFADTPRLSTYVVVVNAGPFVELRERRGDHDLGLYARRSLRAVLERDAAELFDLTEKGLAFFAERFGVPFAQERYDQVFVPNMGGAMENWGCVTWTDAVLYRSTPTHVQRGMRASVLLHEMAHMWFGDLVTMRWWDDLWLNEAFASWAASWAGAEATEFTDAWAGFLLTGKVEAYRQDMSPATHPIRGAVPTVAHAMASFDAITYQKGQAVLAQLYAFIGADAFVEGLRTYFGRHAWGNTVLDDLMTAFGEAAGLDLGPWTRAWLDREGTDRITLEGSGAAAVLRVVPPAGQDEPRPHRLDVASFDASGSGLADAGRVETVTDGTATPIALPDADLHLLNAGDLTFASVRSDDASEALARERVCELPDPTSRALVVAGAVDRMRAGELAPTDVLDVTLRLAAGESSPTLLEPLLTLAQQVAGLWSAPDDVEMSLARVADVASRHVDDPDVRLAALRALAATATAPAHFAVLDAALGEGDDLDLRWRVLTRRIELSGDPHEAEVAALLEADPDPDSFVRALGARAVLDDATAKEDVWRAIVVEGRVPVGLPLIGLAGLFWRPTQTAVLAPYGQRYLDEVATLTGGGLLSKGALLRVMVPVSVADEAWVERARALASDDATHPAVASHLLVGADTVTRVLAARRRRPAER